MELTQAIQQIVTDAGMRLGTIAALPLALMALKGLVSLAKVPAPAPRQQTRQSHIYNK